MRLDKFLKVSRLIKRRPVAKLVIDNKKVKIDGKVAKAGTELKVGNIIELQYYNHYLKVEVVEIPSGNVPKDQASDLIKILESKKLEIKVEDSLEDL